MTSRESLGLLKRFRAFIHLWSGRVHRHYGIVHADQREFANAVESYQRALRINPTLSVAHLELGIIQWRELGRVTHSIQNLNRALALLPDWPIALFNRAQAYQHVSDYKNALDDLRRYIATEDDEWREDALRQIGLLESVVGVERAPDDESR